MYLFFCSNDPFEFKPHYSITDNRNFASIRKHSLSQSPQKNNSPLISPSLFVSPASCLNSQMLSDLSVSHSHSPYLCLKHITSVTKVQKYICSEIMDQSTGNIIERYTEVS